MRADAVHPGYGFLSERAAFARAVRDAGLIFVGPSPEAMAAMGSKIEAKRRVREFDVPVVPGYDGDDQLAAMRCAREAEQVGFPLLIKASAGGGGRGMRVVDVARQTSTKRSPPRKREALAAFGDDARAARTLPDAIRATSSFKCWPTRTATRFIWASASARSSAATRRSSKKRPRSRSRPRCAPRWARPPCAPRSRSATSTPARSSSCSTSDGSFYFLEMNARLQVEHPVTELVYGVDLGAVAAAHRERRASDDRAGRRPAARMGDRSAHLRRGSRQHDAALHRHDRALGRRPKVPAFAWIRASTRGSEVSVYYDPMLAKLIVFGSDRAHAIARLESALDRFSTSPASRRTFRSCCGSRATRRFARERRPRVFSRSTSTNRSSSRRRSRKKPPAWRWARCSLRAMRRGASEMSASRSRSGAVRRARTSSHRRPASRTYGRSTATSPALRSSSDAGIA